MGVSKGDGELRVEGEPHPLYTDNLRHLGKFIIDGRDFYLHTDQVMELLSKCLIVRAEWLNWPSRWFGAVEYIAYSKELFPEEVVAGAKPHEYVIKHTLVRDGEDEKGKAIWKELLSIVKEEDA